MSLIGNITGVIKSEALNSINDTSTNSAKYIQGYSDQSALGQLTNSTLGSSLGLNPGQTDAYDPNHISDAKPEEFWYNSDGTTKSFGRDIQQKYDSDTNTFKRSLNGTNDDFYYEDPLIPSFELFFDNTSPLFVESTSSGIISQNSLQNFTNLYSSISSNDYTNRNSL